MAKVKQFEKVLTALKSGKLVTKEELEKTLGSEFQVYRLSTYIWEIRNKRNGNVEVVKEGKKVIGYRLTNPTEVKAVATKIAKDTKKPAKKVKLPKPPQLLVEEEEDVEEPITAIVPAIDKAFDEPTEFDIPDFLKRAASNQD
jgi:hypothetical protein